MRVIFLGTPDFAVPSLQALMGFCEVCAVFTQPDRPAGRGQKPHTPIIKNLAAAAGIQVLQPEKIRDVANRASMESFHPDCIVVVAYGQILPPWLLQLPRLGCVNVHASLLPRYRGAAPIAWAVLNGELKTGVTTMLMDEHLDTGPMLLRKEVDILPVITTGQLTEKLAVVGAELLLPTLQGLAGGTLTPQNQDDTQATLAPRITKEIAQIEWHRDATLIHNMIRGLNPWPLAWTDWKGIRVQVLRSSPPDGSVVQGHSPGTFWGTTSSGMKIVCGRASVLEILEVQPAGKKKMTGREFANGARLRAGELLRSNIEL